MANLHWTNARMRVLAMLAVAALHALLLYAVQRMRSQQREPTLERASLVLVEIARPRMPEPAPQRERAQPDRQRETSSETSNASLARIESSAPSTPTVPRAIDWRANAIRSAERVAQGSAQDPYRSFGPKKPNAPEEGSPASVFGEGPKHKSGDVGEDAGGDPVVWMNESCYTTLDKRVQTARDWVKAGPGQFAAPEITCVPWGFGRREPDGTLFEHIKKREEPPVPKAGTETNPLPERIEAGALER